ncbi:hypothetical protein Trisim1_012250 [Trichoderma cf. simile WF8]|uniref:DUF7580 domain-containing protein n=1 Tax=Trichoderma guizhouense TaxID=1491466 RepID=A0A1T3CAJ3_9HYPO|nr:hypothetical protein A0O28_0012120 [Trichoderma guizhouense]
MEPLSQVELAQRAAQDVAVVAGNLQTKWRGSWFKNYSRQEHIKNLVILSTSLMCISFSQDRYEQREHRDQQDDEAVKLETFLCGLELVCTYPTNNLAKFNKQNEPSARFPTLNVLVTANSRETIRSASDISIFRKVEKSVEEFASASAYITGPYFAFLKSFSGVKDQAKRHAESAQRDPESQLNPKNTKTKLYEDESYPRHVYDTLYNVINKYSKCNCGLPNLSSKTPRRHWGRLELQANFGIIDDEILFHTVFSKRGSCEYDEKIEWQHLQFRVPRKQRKARAVGFEDKMCYDVVQDKTRREDATEVASISEFCKLLGKDIGSGSMDVRIKDETLLILNRAVEIEVDIADGRSISLADVLSNNSLVPKTKLILAYILAKSVWQFYDSDFMGVCWTTKSIQLFREREDEDGDDEPGVDWAPYYAFSLEQMTERDSMERLPPGQFLHRYPRVLALGAILYELGQKKRWEKQATSSGPDSSTNHIEPPTLEKIINDTSSKIRKGVQKKKWPDISLKNTQTLEEYRVIVANCASENFFRLDPKEKPPNSPAHSLQKTAEELEEELTVAERRAILFKKVVAPLKKMVQTTGWVDELGNIQRYSIEGATVRLKDKRPDSEKSGSETLLDTPQTSQEFRTLPREIQDSRIASNHEAKAALKKAKGVSSVRAPQTAQGLYSDEAKSARLQDNLVDQRLLQDQRDVTGNNFGNRTVIHQGDNHYYSTCPTR